MTALTLEEFKENYPKQAEQVLSVLRACNIEIGKADDAWDKFVSGEGDLLSKDIDMIVADASRHFYATTTSYPDQVRRPPELQLLHEQFGIRSFSGEGADNNITVAYPEGDGPVSGKTQALYDAYIDARGSEIISPAVAP